MNYVDSNLPINAYCQRKYFKLYLKLQLRYNQLNKFSDHASTGNKMSWIKSKSKGLAMTTTVQSK